MLYRLLLLFFSLLCVCGCETIKFAPQTATKKIPPSFDVNNKNFALVLGGGGAKGFAHIGVLEELHNAGLTPDIIIGCSAGSIVGALYAADPNIENLKARTLHQTRKEIRHQITAEDDKMNADRQACRRRSPPQTRSRNYP